MLVLVGIPLLLVTIFGCIFLGSLITGFVLLRSRHRQFAPFFLFLPTFASVFAVLFAWPAAYLIGELYPDAGYFQLLLGFPIGAVFGGLLALIPTLIMLSKMKNES
jgi:hypothetical protein